MPNCADVLLRNYSLTHYQVILVSEVMNVPMRLQKLLSDQQSQLWSAQPLISFQSSLCTIVKCGRLNGMDALLINCTLSSLTLVTAASHISLYLWLLELCFYSPFYLTRF